MAKWLKIFPGGIGVAKCEKFPKGIGVAKWLKIFFS